MPCDSSVTAAVAGLGSAPRRAAGRRAAAGLAAAGLAAAGLVAAGLAAAGRPAMPWPAAARWPVMVAHSPETRATAGVSARTATTAITHGRRLTLATAWRGAGRPMSGKQGFI